MDKQLRRLIREGEAQVGLANTYALDGALASAGRCLRKAADKFEAAQRRKNKLLDKMIAEQG